MIMKSQQLKSGILSVCLIVISLLSCDRRKEVINKQVNKLYSSVIDVPYSNMEALVIDSTCLFQKADYQILVYVDSTECTPCYASHYEDWEPILSKCKTYIPSVTLTIIIDSKGIAKDVKEKFLVSNFNKSIYIDKTGIFRKSNPIFPNSNIMHVFLLNKKNEVVLVGNPLKNKKIEELLYHSISL